MGGTTSATEAQPSWLVLHLGFSFVCHSWVDQSPNVSVSTRGMERAAGPLNEGEKKKKKVALTCWLVWWLPEEKHSINAEQKKKRRSR